MTTEQELFAELKTLNDELNEAKIELSFIKKKLILSEDRYINAKINQEKMMEKIRIFKNQSTSYFDR